MQRKVRYKCDICGLELSNKLKLAQHEKTCADIEYQRKRLTRLFEGLFHHYSRQGWRINIASDGHEIYINISRRR